METQDNLTATVDLTATEAKILKRAINEHATGGESPARKAKRMFERMVPDTEFMPMMYTDETLEDPDSAEELLGCFDGTRFTFTRSQNEQVQLCAMALGMELQQNTKNNELVVEKIMEIIETALGKLGDGYDDLYQAIPEEEREKMADESAKETVEWLTGEQLDDVE